SADSRHSWNVSGSSQPRPSRPRERSFVEPTRMRTSISRGFGSRFPTRNGPTSSSARSKGKAGLPCCTARTPGGQTRPRTSRSARSYRRPYAANSSCGATSGTRRRTGRKAHPESSAANPLALDARAADDDVAAVGEPHPRLAAAVVVGRPDDQRRLLPADATALGPLRLDASPHADERILLPLARKRRLVRVAGKHTPLVRQRQQHVHDRVPDLVEAAAAHRVPEQRVPREDRLVVDDE